MEGQGTQSPGTLSSLKFFPLAFCVLDGNGVLNIPNAVDLQGFASLDPSEEREITISRVPAVEDWWPERPRGNHVVLGGRSYIDSITTVAPSSVPNLARPGRQIQAERWEGGDNAILKQVHAFAEIGDPTTPSKQ